MARDHQTRTRGSVSQLTSQSPTDVVLVSEESKIVLSPSHMRNGLVITNPSVSDIYLGLGREAKPGVGILLTARGGSWDGLISGLLWDGGVSAVAETGDDNPLCVVEV